MAVSIPMYYFTKDRKKAFLFSFLTGLSEPLGALFCYFLSSQFIIVENYLFLSLTGQIMCLFC